MEMKQNFKISDTQKKNIDTTIGYINMTLNEYMIHKREIVKGLYKKEKKDVDTYNLNNNINKQNVKKEINEKKRGNRSYIKA